MAKYLYNGIELPQLPEWDKSTYPYASIADAGLGKYYLRYSAKPALIASAGNVGWGGAMYVCKQGQTDWVYDDVEGIIFPTLIWTNYDAYYADSAGDVAGMLYLKASEPVPVGGEPETVLAWQKHDAYKPNTEWDGKTFYRVMGGKWVKQDSVAPSKATTTNWLTFSSAEPFTLAESFSMKCWDGTLYYSTDTATWSEWDGTTAIESEEHGGEQKIYMRGSGNSIITGEVSIGWVLTGNEISCNGNIENLLDYETVAKGEHPTMGEKCYRLMFNDCTSLVTAPKLPATTLADYCYSRMFDGCTSLVTAPKLPATTLADSCYDGMFYDCTSLTSVPKLPATTLADYCYTYMFYGCSSIKLSEMQTGEYQTPYRIPTDGTGTTEASSALHNMFGGTGGTFTGTPEINTTYYTSNTVV